jgi:ATP-dependent helicase Lhr and Lhr-like helicase
MKKVLSEADVIPFLDSKAAEFLAEARQWFIAAKLNERRCIVDGNSIVLLGWQGDAVRDALALLLTAQGMHASNEGAAIRIFSTDQQRLVTLLSEIASGSIPGVNDLQIKPEQAIREKWDWVLPSELRLRSYVSARLDTLGVQRLALALAEAPDTAAG